MKTRILCTTIFALAVVSLQAQNLSQTVEVTNAYETKLAEIDKMSVEMAVPDSVLRFTMDYDYSIFSSPYRGAYEFSPYRIYMKPTSDAYDAKTLYLRLGAGYSLHPSLDFAWNPVQGSNFHLGIYASHHSYFGKYRNISAVRKDSGDGRYSLLGDNVSSYDTGTFTGTHKGYDALSLAGINGRADWEKVSMDFDLGYKGIHSKDSTVATGLNMLDVVWGLRTKEAVSSVFDFDIKAGFKAGREKLDFASSVSEPLNFYELSIGGSFGPIVDRNNKFLVDAELYHLSYLSLFNAAVTNIMAAPHYVLESYRWRLSLGAKFSLRLRSGDRSWNGNSLWEQDGQVFYPDVHIAYEAVKKHLNLYAGLTGGNDVHPYSDLKISRPFFTPYAGDGLAPVFNNSAERFNAFAGVEGNIAAKFRFDIRGGFARHSDGLIDAVYESGCMVAGLNYADYDLSYMDALLVWDGDALTVDARLLWKDTDLYENTVTGFEPARFSGNLGLKYNYHRRIFAGIGIEGAAGRKGCTNNGTEVYIPAFANLTVMAEYRYTRRLSFWVEGANLLNMTIQRNPLYPESGICFTAGIAVNL